MESNQIIIGSGAEYLYGLIIAMLGRKHVYGIESPSYKKIEQVYRAAEVTYELLLLTHDGIDSTRMWATKNQPKMRFFAPLPADFSFAGLIMDRIKKI